KRRRRLSLTSNVFTGLTKPLTLARCRAAETRYTNLGSVGEEPFHDRVSPLHQYVQGGG
ncbi:hypothetical protein BYT27DRAFT_7341180, partial [Phlegmacium glaucopus]